MYGPKVSWVGFRIKLVGLRCPCWQMNSCHTYWEGRLYWAGAETSTSEWGRLDGAIESGQWAATQVLDFL